MSDCKIIFANITYSVYKIERKYKLPVTRLQAQINLIFLILFLMSFFKEITSRKYKIILPNVIGCCSIASSQTSIFHLFLQARLWSETKIMRSPKVPYHEMLGAEPVKLKTL